MTMGQEVYERLIVIVREKREMIKGFDKGFTIHFCIQYS